VVQSRAELDAQIAAEPSNAVLRYHKWIGEGLGMYWDKNSSWNAQNGIPTTDFTNFAESFYNKH
jgi:hypothetical protein